MPIRPENKEEVYNKYKGHCAYCGKIIDYRNMQIDHIKPRAFGGLDNIENLNPSCRQCNHYKRGMPLEDFRNIWLGKLHERLLKQYTIKVAISYGIVKIKPFNLKFYFEKRIKETLDEYAKK